MLGNQKLSLVKIKKLAQEDLQKMDAIISERLQLKEQLVKDVTYHIINSGGKRLRPVLTILSAKLFGYSQGVRHINLAAAVEFIHTATLLHDDVVDHSKLRRGLPTANKNWDNKSSILVGDFLFSQAFLLMSEDGNLDILKILSKASSIIAEGEVKQLSSIANLDQSVEAYFKIISAKTAELFAASCQVGACIAINNHETQLAMYNFGYNLGIAFQIMDDVLDYTSNESALGKNIGDDFMEGKVTLPIIVAYSRSNQQEKEFWQKAFVHSSTSEDFSKALEILNKYNIIEECLETAFKYTQAAKKCIETAPDNYIKAALIEILNFSISRDF
ncbi:MAG: polyprenyl synthetase family protein [Rickettsiales bacterium]